MSSWEIKQLKEINYNMQQGMRFFQKDVLYQNNKSDIHQSCQEHD